MAGAKKTTRKDDWDRPSRHGAILGEALAKIADEGAAQTSPFPANICMPERCSTCAFRPGSLPNQCAGTLKRALDSLLYPDAGEFWCHHGMKNGEAQLICAGFVAATLAPYDFTKEQLIAVVARLDDVQKRDPDNVRVAFDAWLASIDPESKIEDVYEIARLYAQAKPRGEP